MYSKRLTIALLTTLYACGGEGGTMPPIDTGTPPPAFPGHAFTLDSLRTERQQQNTRFLEFMNENSFRMGLFQVPAGPGDTDDAHSQDEIKYVVSGSGKIGINGVDFDAEPGSAFFVQAQASHRFHSITTDLEVLVVFRSGASAPADPPSLAYAMDEMVAPRSPSTNVWNLFLSAQTMSLGMYMLPRSVGGDNALTHTFDEINIVVNGSARFTAGSSTIDIGPGSVFFVDPGTPHRFTNLSDDLDVLILWER